MKRYLKVALALLCMAAVACKEEQKTIPAAVPIEMEDTVFISIPGGTFVNSKGLTVEIESFLLQKNEVNNRLFRYLADQSELSYPVDPDYPGMNEYFYRFPDYPVVNISPNRAEAVACVIGARLPTRDEWEYAASIGLTGDISKQYPWGDIAPIEAPVVPANYMALDNWEQRDLDGYLYVAPCGSYPLSNAGLADMAGNIAEMVFSTSDTTINIIGGSWAQTENTMTLGFVRQMGYGDITWYAGFRMAK